MATQKTASPANKSQGFQGIRAAFWVIVCCFIIAACFFKFYLGSPSHFQGGDNEGHPQGWSCGSCNSDFVVDRARTFC